MNPMAFQRQLTLCFVEVRLDGQVWISLGNLTKSLQNLGVTRDGEPWRQDVPHQSAIWVDVANVRDTIFSHLQALCDASVAVELWRVPAHIALAHEGTLTLFQADISQYSRCLSMQRAIVRHGGDALAKKAHNTPGVDAPGVIWVAESSLIGKCYSIQPVENMHALTEPSLSPLGRMIMRVDKARGEKLAEIELMNPDILCRYAKTGQDIRYIPKFDVPDDCGNQALRIN